MKKLGVIILTIFYFGCQVDKSDDIPEAIVNEPFDIIVPADFSWSTISQDILLVNIVSDGERSYVLDSTSIELYNEKGDLLDALIIFKGQAGFNFRIPSITTKLKIKAPATGAEMEFSSKLRSFNLEIHEKYLIDFKRVDTDKDGLFDKFDADARNSNLALIVGNKKSTSGSVSKSKLKSYFIFEDLWPSKGDFDFNDFVSGTSFSWKRGKDNFITEISGVSTMEWNTPGFGFGFELFESKGSYLIYQNEVIEELDGDAIKIESLINGFKILSGTQDVGSDTREFTLKVQTRSMTDFVCVPFLFKSDNMRYQIRPFGSPPTQIMQMQMFKSADDDSPKTWEWQSGRKFKYPLQGSKAFYRSKESYPWGIEFLATDFNSAEENISITNNYPKFRNWAESGGKVECDWYNHRVSK